MALTTATISGQFVRPDSGKAAMTAYIEAASVNSLLTYSGGVIASKTPVKLQSDGSASVTLWQLPQAGVSPVDARWRLVMESGQNRYTKEFTLTGDITWDTIVDVSGTPLSPSAIADSAVAGYVGSSSLTRTALDARYNKHDANFINVLDHGAVGDGATDDSGAFATCIAFSRRVYAPKPPTAYLLSSQVTLAGALIEGDGASSKFTGKGFILGNNGRVRHCFFQGANTASTYGIDFANSATVTGWSVTDNFFDTYQQAMNLRGTTTGGCAAEKGFIHHNVFTECQNAVFATRTRRIEVTDNVSTSSISTAQHYTFYGLENSKVTHNYASGGRTGVLLLSRRDLNGGNIGFFGNTITNNIGESITEELISVDCNASSQATSGSVDKDVVSATSISGGAFRITLTDGGWAGTGTTYGNYWIMFYTGALAGKAFRVNGHSTSNFNLDMSRSEWQLAKAGDLVVLGMPFVNNVISNNTLDARLSTTEAIYLYGLAFGNTVNGNVCRGTGTGGIIVTNLNGGPAGVVTGTPMIYPSGGNTITGNVAQDAEITVTYRDITGATPFVPPPNFLSNNNSLNGVVYAADSFDRADSSTTLGHADSGQFWDPKNTAVFGISTNQAALITNGTSAVNTAHINVGYADAAAEVVSTSFSTSGLVLRSTDGQTCFYTTDTALIKRVAGADTTIITFTSALVAGDKLTIACVGNEWRAFKNGVPNGSATDAASNTVMNFGLRFGAGSTAKLTGFAVRPVDLTTVGWGILPVETSIANSVTETPLFTYPVPANSLKVGTTIRITVALSIDAILTASGTLTVRLRYGGVAGVSLTGFAIPQNTGAAQTNKQALITYELTVRTVGGSGTASCMGFIRAEMGSGATSAIGNATNTIDTTAIKDLAFTAQWATANVGNIARAEVVSVEIVKS